MQMILKRHRVGKPVLIDHLPLNTLQDVALIVNRVNACVADGGNCILEFPPNGGMIRCWASTWKGRRAAVTLRHRLLAYLAPSNRRSYKPDPVTGKVKLIPRDPTFTLRSR